MIDTPEPQAPPQEDARLAAFVGSNADYYRKAWRPLQEVPGKKLSFNLAAMLLQVVWLLYRKLYLAAWLLLAVMVADVALVLYLDDSQRVPAALLDVWNTVFALLLLFVHGFYGNYWYWRRFRKLEQAARDRHADAAAQLEFLKIRGGTSRFAAGALVAVFVAPVLWAGYWAMQYTDEGYVFDATGQLTLAEVEANFLSRLEQDISERQWECVRREVEERARAAGDPETLDPSTVEMLPADQWQDLDAFGKRLVLSQVITTKAFFECP
jgi:hypothetical protein